MLRARKTRREVSLEIHLPDLVLSPEEGIDPEQEALLGDSVGLALLVVLDSLTPAERVAFVLHDVFAVTFHEIAPIVGRTPTAARQLASRARRRVQGVPVPDVDPDGQWAVVDAFLAASRRRLRTPRGRPRPGGRPALRRRRGASEPDLDGPRGAGRCWAGDDLPCTRRNVDANPRERGTRHCLGARRESGSGCGFYGRGGRIVGLDFLTDPDRLRQLDLAALAG